MNAASNARCGRCGEVVRADEPLCARCLLDAVSDQDSRAGEERLFQQALALEPGARAAFLREATREDPALGAAVLLLLEGYEEAGGDAAQTTQADAVHARARWAAPTNEEPGTVMGHFRLVRLLGEGGMGSVWRAEQTAPVRRTVALKVIKLGMDTREVVRRFERERQTLALLGHPNIAQVFEAGATALGRPFFAMELVEGQPITAYCEASGLRLEARLRLFRDVCAAVEHAHQKGVIHRDLKPSNILVAGGTVKVIDFGVAKATQGTGDPSHTQHAHMVGTPSYMSPEQAGTGGADVDTRTDVYSLGVVLYELLTGTLPIHPERLATTDLAELQRVLREEEPPPASARLATAVRQGVAPRTSAEPAADASRGRAIPAGRLRGDLDRVLAKAIRKERSERYASAAALSEDLRRHLENEPVSAAPPSLAYHAGKFIRRHRRAVAAVAAVVLALVLGTLVSTVLAVQARRAAGREKVARQEMARTTASLYSMLANNRGRDGHPEQAALWAAKAAEISVDDAPEHDANLRRAALWTAQVPAPLRVLQSDVSEIRKLIFHPLERHLLAESRAGDREVWDIDRDQPLAFGGARLFSAAAWNLEGNLLAVGHGPATGVVLHRFPDGAVVQRVPGPADGTNAVTCLAFNVPGTLLAAGTAASVDIFQRGPDDQFRFLISIPQAGVVHRIVFSPTDPHCLATAVATNLAGLYVVDPGKAAYTVRFASEPHIFQARRIDSAEPPWFDPTGSQLHLCRRTGGVRDRETYGLASYDVASGRLMGSVRPLNGVILGHHPDGRFVVCRHEGGLKRETASVADASDGKDVATVTFNRIVTVAGFDGAGRRALVTSEDGQAVLLAAPDWKPEKRLALHQARIMGAAFAPSGRMAVTAQAGGLIRVWRVQDPHRSFVHLGHDSRVILDPTGAHFAIAGRSAAEATLRWSRVYRTSDGEPAGPVLDGLGPRVDGSSGGDLAAGDRGEVGVLMDAAFAPAGDLLVTANAAAGSSRETSITDRGSLTLWNWRTGERLGERIPTPSEPRSVAWHPQGGEIVVCCAGGEYLSLDPATRRVDILHQTNAPWAARAPMNNGELAYDRSGDILVASGGPRMIHVWKRSGATRRHWSMDAGSAVAGIALHPEGMIAAAQTGTRNGNPLVIVRDVVSGDPTVDPLVQSEWMNSIAFDATGELLLTTARDGLARFWDWRSRRLHCPPVAHRGSVHAGCFVPGTRFAVTGADQGVITLVDPRTGVELSSFQAGPSTAQILEIAISPDGRKAVYGGVGLGGVGVLDLGPLHGPVHLKLRGLLQLTALNAAATIGRDNVLTPMSAEEWLVRWNAFRLAAVPAALDRTTPDRVSAPER